MSPQQQARRKIETDPRRKLDPPPLEQDMEKDPEPVAENEETEGATNALELPGRPPALARKSAGASGGDRDQDKDND